MFLSVLIVDISCTPLVTFRARSVADASPSVGQIIVYATVEQNKGYGYNKSTGVFTAPEIGLYLFSVHACSAAGQNFYFNIAKDEEVLLYGRAYEKTQTHCASATTLAFVNTGENVMVKGYVKCSNACIGESGRNYFLGALLHK